MLYSSSLALLWFYRLAKWVFGLVDIEVTYSTRSLTTYTCLYLPHFQNLVCMFSDNAKFKYLTSAWELRAALSCHLVVCFVTVQCSSFVLFTMRFLLVEMQKLLIGFAQTRLKRHEIPCFSLSFSLLLLTVVCSPLRDHKEELCKRMQLPKFN